MEKDDNADNFGVNTNSLFVFCIFRILYFSYFVFFIFCIFSYFVFKLYLIVDFTTLLIL